MELTSNHLVQLENENIPESTPILDKPLKGSIMDDKGEIVVGASIIVKGTNKGTTSDANGNFNLSVPNEGSSIIVSSVGYESQEILFGNKAIIDVILKRDLKQLDEVVIVGYGVQKKKDLTGALSSIQSKDIVRGNPTLQPKHFKDRWLGQQSRNRIIDLEVPTTSQSGVKIQLIIPPLLWWWLMD